MGLLYHNYQVTEIIKNHFYDIEESAIFIYGNNRRMLIDGDNMLKINKIEKYCISVHSVEPVILI